LDAIKSALDGLRVAPEKNFSIADVLLEVSQLTLRILRPLRPH
jgi:hypothetical protein